MSGTPERPDDIHQPTFRAVVEFYRGFEKRLEELQARVRDLEILEGDPNGAQDELKRVQQHIPPRSER